MREWFDNAMYRVRIFIRTVTLGGTGGAAIVYWLLFLPLQQDVAHGWCGQYDHRGRYNEFNCRDPAIADALVRASMATDEQSASVFEDMAKHQPKRKTR